MTTEIVDEKEVELCGIKYRAVMLKIILGVKNNKICYSPRIMKITQPTSYHNQIEKFIKEKSGESK